MLLTMMLPIFFVGGLLDHYSAASVIEAMTFLNKTTCAAPKNDRKQVLKYWLDLIDNLSDILTHVYLEEMGNTDTHYSVGQISKTLITE